jgi:hypothetical protein
VFLGTKTFAQEELGGRESILLFLRSSFLIKGLFESAIVISAILKIMFLKLLLFKVTQTFGKTC